MPVLTVEKPLRDSLGNDAAVDSLVKLINQAGEEQKRDILEFVEEKFERRLSEEINGLEIRLSEKIVAGDSQLSESIAAGNNQLSERIVAGDSQLFEKIAKLEGSLNAKISASKAELIKWMFIFWVGQVGMILSILFAFFK